jgi:hypothetical protein
LISAKQVDKKFGKANRAPFPRRLRSTAVRNPTMSDTHQALYEYERTCTAVTTQEDGAVFLKYHPRLVGSNAPALTRVFRLFRENRGLPHAFLKTFNHHRTERLQNVTFRNLQFQGFWEYFILGRSCNQYDNLGKSGLRSIMDSCMRSSPLH